MQETNVQPNDAKFAMHVMWKKKTGGECRTVYVCKSCPSEPGLHVENCFEISYGFELCWSWNMITSYILLYIYMFLVVLNLFYSLGSIFYEALAVLI